MFIKLGLVSGCSEYCRRQSRPRGAGGASEGWRGRGPLQAGLNAALQGPVSPQQSYHTPKAFFCYLFCPESTFKVINLKATQTFAREIIDSASNAVTTRGSLTHAVFAVRVHFSETQVADRSEGVC